MNIKTLGIDLSKHVFQLHGVDLIGKPVLKKKLSREKLPEFMATLSPCELVMEACGGANFWAREFKQVGHHVKLISPQFVKPFVKVIKMIAMILKLSLKPPVVQRCVMFLPKQ